MGLPLPLREPWAITQGGLELVLSVASRGELFAEVREQALQARDGKPLQNTRTVTVRDGVAVIPVSGPLFRHAGFFGAISGATSYATLRKDLEAALDDVAVKAIVFDIDSPGGEVCGCGELSAALFAARGRKPIVAYAGGTCASAAYWIASGAGEVVCAPTAVLGSVGVRTLMIDASKFDEKMGIKQYDIVSSQSPYKVADASDADDRARVQAAVTSLASVFIGDVARNRGTTDAKVTKDYGRGDVLIGQDAVDAGLADRIGNLESVIAELSARRPANLTGAAAMAEYTDEECEECMEGQAKSKALVGLDAKATGEELRARIVALVDLEGKVIAATECNTAAEAVGKIGSALTALRDLPGMQAELAKERSEGIRRDLRATLESGLDKQRLSLGAISKTLPIVLRGEQKTAWSDAMGKIKTVTRESVLDAACSVAISRDDATAIAEFVKSAAPIAAQPFDEPPRETDKEVAELDETAQQVKRAADATRATLDRGKKTAKAK